MYKQIVTFGLFCYLFTAIPTFATTRYVPQNFKTIQAAIDASANGDEVVVSPGVYVESLAIKGKYITLRSIEGPQMTAIWGDKKGAVIDVQSLWGGPVTVIDGFEITSKWSVYNASGISCSDCSLKVANCIVHGCDNHGIECYESFVEISNTFVVDNNSALDGAGIYGVTADFNIINSTIANNVNVSGGAGIFLNDSIYFTKCRNSIIWGNISKSSTFDQVWLKNMAGFVVENSDLQDGAANIYVELYCMLSVGPGMIDADPEFVDSSINDFHLTYISPCKDAGDNAAPSIPTKDFEYDPRIAYGTVDMGADEFYTHLYYTGNATPGKTITLNFTDTPSSQPVFLFAGSGVLDPPFHSKKYGDFYLKQPLLMQLYLGAIPIPKGVLSFSQMLDPSFPVMDIPLQALIGKKLTNLMRLHIE